MTVAALFVETGGCYYGLLDVDPWDHARDARLYAGPHPVVAHPPCQRWGAMAFVNYARWGGDHNRPGNDGGCFASALNSVRREAAATPTAFRTALLDLARNARLAEAA